MIFIESKVFEKLRAKYLDEDEYHRLQDFLLSKPMAGDVIQGTGGLRKLRWALRNKGKRGGIRIIYLYITARSHVHFLTVYAKNEVSDLTTEEKKILKHIVEEIKNAQP